MRLTLGSSPEDVGGVLPPVVDDQSSICSAVSIASALFITTALSGSFQTEFPNGRFWRKAAVPV
jgi:hypothetical protein